MEKEANRFIIATQQDRRVVNVPTPVGMRQLEKVRATAGGGKKMGYMSNKRRILGMNFLIVKEKMIGGWEIPCSIWLELQLGRKE